MIFLSVFAGGCQPLGEQKSPTPSKPATDSALAEAHLNRGMTFHEKQEYAKAVEAYTEAIRLDPELTAVYNLRGTVYTRMREDDKAIEDFSQAIRLGPDPYVSYTNRGNVYFWQSECEKATKDYESAIRLDPKRPRAYTFLARLLSTSPKDECRDGKKAVENATKGCEMSGWKEPYSIDALAAAYAEIGDFKNALKWQEKAIEYGIPHAEELEMARRRLTLFESKKPYRDPRCR
jgi:tetratricopeptide (TPR) repeat protein